ncbi:MAG: DUF4091 domain-containing protein [Acidobacteriota bacterium]|nr:DUF4091 domain-containing protein [Acidobacteriota bacterium]
MSRSIPHRILRPISICALVIPALTASAQETTGVFALVEHNLPESLQPGERFVGRATWRVVEPGQPLYTTSVLDFSATGAVKRTSRLPRAAFTPWYLPKEQAPGDTFTIAFTLDVGADFPLGDALISLLLARNTPEKGWQYANLQDGQGNAVGAAFRWPLKIARRAGEVEPVGPLVAGRVSPTLDGQIGPDEWRGAGEATLRENNGGAPKASTRLRVGFDDRALYVAFDCDETDMEKTARNVYPNHDGSIWNNECVEVFLDAAGDQVSFVHFITDILNQRHDLLGNDSYGYNPQWESAVSEREAGWSVEMALPFSSIGVPAPTDGDAWRANFCRERKAVNELSAWRPTFGSFNAPGSFGLLVFGSLKAYLIEEGSKLELVDGTVPESVARAADDWQTAREAWRDKLAGLDDEGVRPEFETLNATLDDLRKGLKRIRLQIAAAEGKSIAVSRAWPYAAFRGERPENEGPGDQLSLRPLINEWTDLAWNVTNFGDRTVTLRATLRPGDPKDPLPHLSFGLPGVTSSLRLATPVATGDGRAIHDALTPIPAGTFSVPPGETVQVWLSLQAPEALPEPVTGYLRVEPVDGSDIEPLVMPLGIQTCAADIRSVRPIHAFTWNVLPEVVASDPDWYAAHLRDLSDHGVDVCAIHSLSTLPRVKANADGTLAEPLDFTRTDRLIDASKGLFNLYFVSIDIFEKGTVRRDLFGLRWGSPEYEKAFKTWFAQVLQHLLDKGLTREQLIVNPYDESVNEDCQTLARWIKDVDLNLRIIIDCSTRDIELARRMDALTDIWQPHYKYHFAEDHREFFELLREGGKPHWVYYYSEGSNEKGQDPTRHYLGKFWWAYSQGIDGIGYWAQQYYGDPWYRAAWKFAYDTSLVYPVEDGLVASRRWEAWRRGWQDANLLALAKAALEQRDDQAGAARLDELVKQVVAVPGDQKLADDARDWLREVICPIGRD